MINELFPQEKPDYMPDRVWETYCCLVWCCNSLGAVTACLRYTSKDYFLMEKKWGMAIREEAEKAREVICFLLKDSGRMAKFDKWEAEREKKEESCTLS